MLLQRNFINHGSSRGFSYIQNLKKDDSVPESPSKIQKTLQSVKCVDPHGFSSVLAQTSPTGKRNCVKFQNEVRKENNPKSQTTSNPAPAEAPAWMEDERLATTPVFLKKFNLAATVIQTISRGVLQRKAYRRAQIAKIEKEIRAIRDLAATRIQCMARVWRARLVVRILSLEKLIEDTNNKKKSQLQAIQKRRDREMERIEKMYYGEDLEFHKKQEAQLKKNTETVNELRKENKKLRSKNDKLREAVEAVTTDNQTIELQMSLNSLTVAKTKTRIQELAAENEKWVQVLRAFDQRRQEFEFELAKRNEYFEFEKTVCIMMRESVNLMIKYTSRSSQGKHLKGEILNIMKSNGL